MVKLFGGDGDNANYLPDASRMFLNLNVYEAKIVLPEIQFQDSIAILFLIAVLYRY